MKIIKKKKKKKKEEKKEKKNLKKKSLKEAKVAHIIFGHLLAHYLYSAFVGLFQTHAHFSS
jgi:hypothetical protein